MASQNEAIDETGASQGVAGLLASVSTATINTQLFRRGLRNTVLKGLLPANSRAARFVGPAFTLRYIPAREDVDGIEVFNDPHHPQRLAIETAPRGSVLVMDCRQDAGAASGGSILVRRLAVRGVAALVTDASLRDFGSIGGMDFPAFSRGPNPALNLVTHHAADIQVPIGCAGVAIYPGDIVVGDSDGVVAIPKEIAMEVAAASFEQENLEKYLAKRIEDGAPLVGTYPPNEQTLAEYESATAK
jgi:regulator of RNase E activity RraA